MCNFIIHLGLGGNPRASSVYHSISAELDVESSEDHNVINSTKNR